jgi:ATP-dependent Clp protease ATP-binding subunit ClpB
LLLDPLSLDVLDGKFTDGDVITADATDGRVVFSK